MWFIEYNQEVEERMRTDDFEVTSSAPVVSSAGTAATELCQLVLDGDLDPKEVRPKSPARSHLEVGPRYKGKDVI